MGRMVSLRKAKQPTAMRVKDSCEPAVVLVSETGTFETLVPGKVFRGDDPVVKEFAWAFEADDTISERRLQALSGQAPSAGARPTLDRRARDELERVHAEIAELRRPLPTPSAAGADIEALSKQLAARRARCEALEMTVPALERDAMLADLRVAEGVAEIETRAAAEAARNLRDAEAAFKQARSEMEQLQAIAWGAGNRQSQADERMRSLRDALAAHNAKHGFADTDHEEQRAS